MSTFFNCGEFECRKRKTPATPSNCPPCPTCKKCPTASRPTKPRTVEGVIPKDLLFNEIGFPTETLGQPTFEEEAAQNAPLGIGCSQIQLNNEYEDEADQWFSSTPTPNPVPGCMDPAATNYNPAATIDDGTCTYGPIPGCMDPAASNYNPAATVDDGSCLYGPQPVKQYIPTHTLLAAPMSQPDMINTMTQVSNADKSTDHQGVDGINRPGEVAGYTNPLLQWDGVPFNPVGKTNAEICAFVKPLGAWPNPFVYKGLLQKYNEVQPFADEVNPTVAEIDKWNLEVVNHFRNLFGIPPMQPDARLYLECRWADERKYTQDWDTAYPAGSAQYPTAGAPGGPCWLNGAPYDTSGTHCGAAFFPNETDRAPYIAAAPYNNDLVAYPELSGYTARASAAEGKSGATQWIPWGVKMAHVLTQWLCSEGITGHSGPYFGNPARGYIGMSWWLGSDGGHNYRGKYR